MNPYETLGIPPTASAEQIKSAYRRRAKETHPDKGNDGAEFALVAKAYAVLSDPDMRARYDDGGGIDEIPIASVTQAMVSILASLLGQALDETARANADPKRINYVQHIRQNVTVNIGQCKQALNTQRKIVADATVLLKRITRKGDGENAFVHVLKERIEKQARPIRENEINLKALERLNEELAFYTNEVEIMQAFSVMQYGPGAFSQTGTASNSVFWNGR